MENRNFDTVAEVEDYMTDVVQSAPEEENISPDSLAQSVAAMLDLQFGKDSSNVRSIFTFKQLRSSAMAHLRRSYERTDDESNQLGFTHWGNDIQDRYPVKIDGERVYASPLYAPVEQLENWCETHQTKAETTIRRVDALREFIREHRA